MCAANIARSAAVLQEEERAKSIEILSQCIDEHGPDLRFPTPSPSTINITAEAGWQTGIEAIDSCLPNTRLNCSALHEIEPLRLGDLPCLPGFTFGLLRRLAPERPIIWCMTALQAHDYGHPYAFGMARYGLSPTQILIVKVGHPKDLQFAMEEALKTKGIAAVVGEGPRPCFTGSRRLSLLARAHQTPCLLLSADGMSGSGSAALTRWQVSPAPGIEDPRDPLGPGMPTWRVALPRSRGGRAMPAMASRSTHHTQEPYPWRIVWDEQTLSFRPASVFLNGAVSASRTQNDTSDQTVVGRTGGQR